MSKDFRYILDKTGKKHHCPACEKRRFVRYVDTETKAYMPEKYGRCDRESNCGYHEHPPLETRCFFVPFIKLMDYSNKSYRIENKEGEYFIPKSQVYEVTESGCYVSEFVLTKDPQKAPYYISTDCKYYSESGLVTTVKPEKGKCIQSNPVYFIPETVLNATLKTYDNNTFIQNLLKLAPIEEVEKVISLYRIGTIGKGERQGSVTFPFIDKSGNIRTIQAKEFNETNHTIKNGTDFVHSIIARHYTNKGEALPFWLNDYTKNEKFVSCLFGEHLLNKYPLNPIALVEAPKTAIIGALYYGLPETPGALLWLAVYNKSSLSVEKCKALQGRKVALFPDLNAFNEWSTRTNEIKAQLPGTRFVVSDLLEKNATETERTNGLDLADYLTKFDYRLFRREPEQIMPPQKDTMPQASHCSYNKEIEIQEPKVEVIPVQIRYMTLPPPKTIKHDYIAADGILYTHWSGLPELTNNN